MLVSVRAEFHRDRVLLVRENPVQWMYEKRRTRGQRLERLEKERKDEGERRRISTARRRGNKTKGRKEILRILPRLSSTISASVLVIVLVDVHGLQRSAIRVASPWKPGGENRNRPRLLSKVTPTLILEQSPSATVRET